MAHEQHNKATHLNEAATDLGSDARSVTAGWTGDALVAFAAHAGALCDSLTVVAESHGAASTALDTWADALQAAQTAYDEAVDEAALAVEQEREAAEQAQHLLPSLAPDAGSPVPRVASPLRSITRQDAEAAIAYARQAAQRCAAVLRALVPEPPAPPATPRPAEKHHGVLSSIGHCFQLEPEVAGGKGEHTERDFTVQPMAVTRLHYEVAGWQGDDLLESTPCFVISPEAAAALAAAGMRSFTLADALMTLLPGTEDLIDHRVLTFRWLQPTGQPGVDDIALDSRANLIVGEAAWDILRTFHMTCYEISDWPPAES